MKLPSQHDKEETRRLILAALLALVIVLGYRFFFITPQMEKMQQQQQQSATQQAAPAPVAAPQSLKLKAEVVASTARVPIRGDRVTGSISLTGARIDDLSLNDQYTTLEK